MLGQKQPLMEVGLSVLFLNSGKRWVLTLFPLLERQPVPASISTSQVFISIERYSAQGFVITAFV